VLQAAYGERLPELLDEQLAALRTAAAAASGKSATATPPP
jgi:hypothetical protein